jgi:glycosyltransferase involved in cell wall biosynthesis
MITVDARWINSSGIGTYLRNLLPGLVGAMPNHEFSLLGDVCGLERINGLHRANVRLIAADAPMYSLSEQLELARKIPRQTELFFATHYNIPLLYQGKMLVTVYDLFHLAMPEMVGGLHKRLYARVLFKAVRRRAAEIITISQFTRDELIRLTGPATQAIHPIHLGVEDSWFHIPDSPSPHPKPYILFVGNVKPHKNLGALIDAFARICDLVPHDLVLVGKNDGFITGDKSVTLQAQELDGRVKFTGLVDDKALKTYFAHADSMVFPSLYEGFGLPPLEAMAAGCPVLVSAIGPMPELFGNAALYCDPRRPDDIAAKLLSILRDSNLRDDLRTRGLERARTYTWDKCVTQTAIVVERLVNTQH